LQDGCRAELEGVTFVGRSDLAASKDAPAISMTLCHMALMVGEGATARLKGVLRDCIMTGTQDSNSKYAGHALQKGHHP
jgi:hypothetical protein